MVRVISISRARAQVQSRSNIFNQFSYQVSFNQAWSPNGIGGTVTAEGPLLIRTLSAGLPSGTRRVEARAEKFVKPLNANIRLGANLTEIRSQLDLGAVEGTNVYRVLRIRARYQTQLLPTLKAALNYEYRTLTNTLTVAAAGEPNATVRTEQLEGILSWKPSRKFNFQSTVRHYGWRQPDGLNPTTLWSANAGYVFNDRWSASLRAFNLLGQTDVSWVQASSFLTTRRVIPLRGRTLMLEITRSF